MKRTALALLLLLSAGLLSAQQAPERGLSLRNSIGGMLNPTGVSIATRLYYTEPLYGDRAGVLWETARLEMGIRNQLSPAYDDVSLDLFVEPVALVDFRGNIGLRYAYNALGYGFTPLSSYESDYSDAGSRPSETRTGFFVHLTPRLKAALGPLIFLNAFTWSHYSFNAEADSQLQGYFYEPTNNVILKDSEFLMKNSTTLLYSLPLGGAETRYLTGVDYTMLYVPDSQYRSQKVSLMAAVQHQLKEWDMSIDAALLIGAFLENRYYAVSDGYISPALQMGLTKGL